MGVMKLNEVINSAELFRSSIYACMLKDYFPKPIQLGPTAVAWIEGEVHKWLSDKAGQRG